MGYLPLRVEVATRDVMAVLHLHKAHPQVCADVERRMCQLIKEVYEEKVDLRSELEESSTCVCKALVEQIVEKTLNDAIPHAEAEAVLREQAALLQTVSELRNELTVKDNKICNLLNYLQNVHRAHNYMLHSYFREVFMLRVKIDELEHREPVKHKYESLAMSMRRVPSNRTFTTSQVDEFNTSKTFHRGDERVVDNNNNNNNSGSNVNEENSGRFTTSHENITDKDAINSDSSSSVHKNNSFVANAERTMEYNEYGNINDVVDNTMQVSSLGHVLLQYAENEHEANEIVNYSNNVVQLVSCKVDNNKNNNNSNSNSNNVKEREDMHVIHVPATDTLSTTNHTFVNAAHTTQFSSCNNDTETSSNNVARSTSCVRIAPVPPIYEDNSNIDNMNTCASTDNNNNNNNNGSASNLEVCKKKNVSTGVNEVGYENSSKIVDVQSENNNNNDDDDDESSTERVYPKCNDEDTDLCDINDSTVKNCKDSCSELLYASELAPSSSTTATTVASRSKYKAQTREANYSDANSKFAYSSSKNANHINATNSVSGRSVDAIFDYEKYVAMLQGKITKPTSCLVQSPCHTLHTESPTEDWTSNLFGNYDIPLDYFVDDWISECSNSNYIKNTLNAIQNKLSLNNTKNRHHRHNQQQQQQRLHEGNMSFSANGDWLRYQWEQEKVRLNQFRWSLHLAITRIREELQVELSHIKLDMNKLLNYFTVQVQSAQREVEHLDNVVETLKEFLFSYANGVTSLVNDIIHDASAHSPVEMMQRSNDVPLHSAVLNFFDCTSNPLRVRVQCQLQTSLPLDRSDNTPRVNVQGSKKKNAANQMSPSEREAKQVINMHADSTSHVGKESEPMKPNSILSISSSGSKNSNSTNMYGKSKKKKKKGISSQADTLTDNTRTTSQTYNASAGLEYWSKHPLIVHAQQSFKQLNELAQRLRTRKLLQLTKRQKQHKSAAATEKSRQTDARNRINSACSSSSADSSCWGSSLVSREAMDNVEYGHQQGQGDYSNEYDPAWRLANVICSNVQQDKKMTGQELLEQLTALRCRRVCNKARRHQCQVQLDKCMLYKQMSAKCADHDDVNYLVEECKQRMQKLVQSIDEDGNTINLYVQMLQAHLNRYRLVAPNHNEHKSNWLYNSHYAHGLTDINGNHKNYNKNAKLNTVVYSKNDRNNKRDLSDVNSNHDNSIENSKNIVKSTMSELLSSPYLYSSEAHNESKNVKMNRMGWCYVPINSPEAVHSVKMNNGCSAGVVIFNDNVIPLSHFFTNVDSGEVGTNTTMPSYARQFSETRSAYHAVMDYCTGVQKGNPLSKETTTTTATTMQSISGSTFTGLLYLMQDKETHNYYVANAKGENLLKKLEERNEEDKKVANAIQEENTKYYNNNNNSESTSNDKGIIPMTQIIYPIPASLISQEGKLIGTASNHLPDLPLPLVDQYPYKGMIKVDFDARSVWQGEFCQTSLTNVAVKPHTQEATLIPAYLVPLVEPMTSVETEDTLHRLPTSALYSTNHEVDDSNCDIGNYNDDENNDGDDSYDDGNNRNYNNSSARRSYYAAACKSELASTYTNRLLPSLALSTNQRNRTFRQGYESDTNRNEMNNNITSDNIDNSINDTSTISHNHLGTCKRKKVFSSVEQEPRIMRPPTEENMSLLQIKSFSAPKEVVLSDSALENNLNSKTNDNNNNNVNDGNRTDGQLHCQQSHLVAGADGIGSDIRLLETKECATNTSRKEARQVCVQGNTCKIQNTNQVLNDKAHLLCKTQGDDKNVPMIRSNNNSNQSCRLPHRIPRLQSKLPSPYETVKMQRRLQPFTSTEKLSSTLQPQKGNRHV